MTGTPRYLVAKYVSDLQRMEPRNIGIILCIDQVVVARFAAEKDNRPGDIDGRSVPPFVTSTAAYKQWVEFWRSELGAVPTRAGRSLDTWYARLKDSGRGNFFLVDGGVILGDVGPDKIENLVQDLFRRLVEPSAFDDVKDQVLDDIADQLIRKLRLHESANFRTRYEVACQISPGVDERFEFSHAYKNGTLKRLYQRVPLGNKKTPLRRVVHDSAWMFEKVVQQGIVARDQAVALVYANKEQQQDPAISWSFGVLNSVSRVANLADTNEALMAFVIE